MESVVIEDFEIGAALLGPFIAEPKKFKGRCDV
jgi:hypothetical protein